ncbi:unnamed protein product [Brassicogethes aeneus]|uniref:Uncharacterized protein n=1 Tax=Brassicogethes aeneus TaxID=1431903 RepID=A0A9P0BCT2_BRAAE|nr:unnamed protein product [Brassicogethes aeneus]
MDAGDTFNILYNLKSVTPLDISNEELSSVSYDIDDDTITFVSSFAGRGLCDILNESHKGKCIQEYYKQNFTLDKIHRDYLVSIILEDVHYNGQCLAPKDYPFILNKYVKCTRAPSDEKIWPKYHSEPWLIVEEKWNATVNQRKAEFNSCDQTNITSLLAGWPAYMKENGQRLIDIDFDSQFTGRINKLHEKWGDFVVQIIPYFKKNIKDKPSLELLKGLQNQDLNVGK